MPVRLVLRKDKTENWKKYNPILSEGEFGYDTTNKTLKIGDGITSWLELENIMEVKK